MLDHFLCVFLPIAMSIIAFIRVIVGFLKESENPREDDYTLSKVVFIACIFAGIYAFFSRSLGLSVGEALTLMLELIVRIF